MEMENLYMNKTKNLKVINNNQISEEYFLMKIDGGSCLDKIKPGQFLHIKVQNDESVDPLLRRPLSIHDINYKNNSISLLYRLVGRGTRKLSKYKPEDLLNILGPLGNGFNTNFTNKNILVIGGGMGIAPLYLLTKSLVRNNSIMVLLGGNSSDDMNYFNNCFGNLNIKLKIATMDGSLGFSGTVIDMWNNVNNEIDFIYSCGPKPMLKEVQKKTNRLNISGEVSLEERMGCGIGVCLSCTCSTEKGNQRVCQEGPVFPINEVVFDD